MGERIIYIVSRQSWYCEAWPKYLEKLISEWLFNYLTTNDFPGIESFGFALGHFLLGWLERTCDTARVLSSKVHCIGVTVIDFTMGSTKTSIKVLTNYFNASSLLVGTSNTFGVQKIKIKNCAFQILLPNLEPFFCNELIFSFDWWPY